MRSGFIEPRNDLRTVFVGQPALVEEIEGTRTWRLMRDVQYRTDEGILITAPAGMVTDFASVPRPFWLFFPPWSPTYGRAAIIHDRLYKLHGHTTVRSFTRRECDFIFRDAMRDLGAGYLTRQTILNAVRLFNPEWPDESHEKHTARTFYHRTI